MFTSNSDSWEWDDSESIYLSYQPLGIKLTWFCGLERLTSRMTYEQWWQQCSSLQLLEPLYQYDNMAPELGVPPSLLSPTSDFSEQWRLNHLNLSMSKWVLSGGAGRRKGVSSLNSVVSEAKKKKITHWTGLYIRSTVVWVTLNMFKPCELSWSHLH